MGNFPAMFDHRRVSGTLLFASIWLGFYYVYSPKYGTIGIDPLPLLYISLAEWWLPLSQFLVYGTSKFEGDDPDTELGTAQVAICCGGGLSF